MARSFYFASSILISAFIYWLRPRARPKRPLPPGPRKLPLLGNLLDVPAKEQWLTFTNWGKDYDSDVIHVEAAGHSLVILNSYGAMDDLLNKRSAIYSGRAFSRVIYELVGWNWLMVLMPYNEAWKERRRLFVRYIHPSDTSLHRASETRQLYVLLNQLINEPDGFLKHIRHMVAASAISMTYGIKVEESNDPFVSQAENTINNLSRSILPGTFLAETFCWLRHIPEGFPGTGWKAKVRQLRSEMLDFLNKPYDAALEAIARGTSTDSFVSRCQQDLRDGRLSYEEEELVKEMAALVFIAGAETTVSAISTFFLAMVCFPDAYKEAQAKVDRVLKGHISEDGDEKTLPYLNALLKEVFRWQPVFPMCIFHAVTEDDEYRGYHIPRDSLIIPNVWAFAYDEKMFPEPEKFKPERFLKDGKLHVEGPDPQEVIFGFGRRACPGRHIGESILFHIAASVLSLFDISKVVDVDGMPIEPLLEYSSGMTRQPVPFKCSIKPRSREAANLIRSLS